MSDVRKTKQEEQIPEHLINQLNEYAIGGFALFYFNRDSGEPEQIMSFDDRVHAIAMEKYIEDYSKALRELQVGNIQESIINNFGVCPPPEEDDEED